MKALPREQFDQMLTIWNTDPWALWRDYPSAEERGKFYRRLKNPKLLERDARLIEAIEKEQQNAPEPVLREGRCEGSQDGPDTPPGPF